MSSTSVFLAGGVLVATAIVLAQDAPPTASAPETAASAPASRPASDEFVRFVDEGEGVGRLETAIVTYVDEKGRQVDLIGAVHVGEPSYYKQLNEDFRDYEAVLYEMVKPKSAVVKPGQKHDSALSKIQNTLRWMLGLEFQLDGIDYQAENFVHADLTPDEFMKSMEDKGESFLTLFWNMFTAEMARASSAKPEDAASSTATLLAFFSKDRARILKYVFGKQMSHLEEMAAGLEKGPNGGSTLVIERNKRALSVMKEQLEAGKTRIAVFYGAAHLPDMEQRLVKEHGFMRTQTRWLTAWDIPPGAKP